MNNCRLDIKLIVLVGVYGVFILNINLEGVIIYNSVFIENGATLHYHIYVEYSQRTFN